ncbi:reverse transcriptase zinc-binding domain-containing protein [Tanacetum coccineum]
MDSNEKQQLFAQKVQQQNTTLTSQLELYKERVRVLENIKGDNNYLNEFLKADRQAKHFNQQAQSQFIHDRDIIQDLKQQRDKLDLAVIDYKREKEEYQKTQMIFNQTQHDKEEKYLNDILQLQAKVKDLENVVCKMGKSTETLRLLTNEQKAFRDNLRKSGLGYNGPYVLSQAYAKIPKLYRAYELCDENEQLHVFNFEDTLEDAEKSRLKMNEFQNDEKVQALKIKPIDYGKLNKLYDDFVPQKELSAEQTYFPSSFISSEKVSSETKPSMASMPSANPMLVDLNVMENVFKKLFELLEKNCKRESIFYTSKEELRLIDVCVEAKSILREWHVYFEVFQNRFKRDVKEMKDVFVSVENDLDETFKQNELLKDQLLEASLAEDIKNLVITSCVEIRNKDLHDETERISKESKDVSNESKTADTVCNDAFEVTQELSKRIVELEKDLSKFEAKSIAFEIALQHKSRENNSLKTLQKENENFMASLQIENAHLKQTYKDLSFFEKEKINGPNFIDWYNNLRIVLTAEDKLTFLEQPVPPAHVHAERQVLSQQIRPSLQYGGIWKTVNELHAMLKLHEETLPKKEGKNQGKRTTKLAYAPNPKIHPPHKKNNPAKDAICHECNEIGHQRKNCPKYLAELMKKMKLSQGVSTSGTDAVVVGLLHEVLQLPRQST